MPLEEPESRQSFPSRSTSDPALIRAFAVDAARLLQDDKCEGVVVLDVRELSQITDYLVIASGSSDRQMRSAAQHLKDLAGDRGLGMFRSDVDTAGTWILADFVDVVVHIFEPNTRAHYDLEMLWGDAPHVPWERDGAPPRTRDHAGLHRRPR